MTLYDSPQAISDFLSLITEYEGKPGRPAFVNDLDGNLMIGYSLVPGQQLVLSEGDDPRAQAIPSGSTQAQIQEWVRKGTLREGIFAEKPMDVRLPEPLVALVNDRVSAGAVFDIAFLTSRGTSDALSLLQESGVDRPEQVTLVADSGATLYLHGVRHDVRRLNDEERAFLAGIDRHLPALTARVRAILSELGFDPADHPQLYVETKGVAVNVHHRQVLTLYDQPEGSELDQHISAAVKTELHALVEVGPREPDGSPSFRTLDGPATVEVKLASVNKGHGLHAIVAAAMQAAQPPTAIIFTGDDVSKGNGLPGTDYFAMAQAPTVAMTYRVPVYNILTLHPLGGGLDGTEPDQRKFITTLSKQYQAPVIDLCVASPRVLARIILAAHGRA